MPIGILKLINKDVELTEIRIGEETHVDGIYYIDRWVNLEVELKNLRSLTLVFPFNNTKYEFFYRKSGKDVYYFDEEYSGRLCVVYFDGNGSFKFSESSIKNHIFELDRLFLDEGFSNFYVSNDLIHMRTKMKLSYGLNHYNSGEDKMLIFGLYNNLDLEILRRNENSGILWGGSDIMLDKNVRSQVIEIVKERNSKNFAMSRIIYDKLLNLGVKNVKIINVSFCWNDIRYRVYNPKNQKKKSIYIYDGMDKSKKKNIIYNQDLVDKVVEKLGNEFKIYRSSDGFRDDVIELYKESFVSLRLTEYDGNANSAQECGMLGIPVISNQDMNHCINWVGLEDILFKIRYIFDNNIRIKWEKSKINVMLISCDMPGKGGGATFTGNMAEYLRGKGFNIWEVYLIHSCNTDISLRGKRVYIKFNHKRKWDLMGNLEKAGEKDERFKLFMNNCKVILRSSVGDYKRLKERFKVIFMSPGIYKNDLGKDFDMKYVNSGNVKLANTMETYANSKLTQSIFHKFGLNEVGCLEINLLQLRNYYFSIERDIDFLFVVSNVDRKIKNTKLFLELAEKMSKKFVLISAEKVKNNYTNVEIVINPKKLEEYYRRSKFLINCSYFDSMSNVVLEGLNNGCHIIVSENNGITEYIDKDVRDKFIVDGYEYDIWEEKLEDLLKEWESMEKDRKKLWDDLRRKSWEVGIRLQNILKDS